MGLEAQPLGSVALVLALPPDHPLALLERPLTSDDLASFRLVQQAGWPWNRLRRPVGAHKILTDGFISQVDAIRHGLGIGYVPLHFVRDDVDAGRLVTREIADAPVLTLCAAWVATEARSGVDWFRERLANQSMRAQLVHALAER